MLTNITFGDVYVALVIAFFVSLIAIPFGILVWGYANKFIKKIMRIVIAIAIVILFWKGISLISEELSWWIYGIGTIVAAVVGAFFFQILHAIWTRIWEQLKKEKMSVRIAVICITLAVLLIITTIIILSI